MLGLLFLNLREAVQSIDGIVDAGRCQHRVELAAIGRRIVFGENGFNRPLALATPSPGWEDFAFGLEVIHVEAQDVAILDGVSNGVLMQATLGRGRSGCSVAGLLTFDLLVAGVFSKIGCTGKAKKLGDQKFLDSFVVVAEL